MTDPPPELVRALREGPSLVRDLEWHPQIDSTNRRALDAAAEGAPEGLAVLADVQTGGRGRRGRTWEAPAGTSLLLSLLLRPPLPPSRWTLLPLVTGVALADAAGSYVPDAEVSLKWPNDVLVDGAKVAGILVETTADAAVVGVGVNVDWRGIERSAELLEATSLAEVAEAPVDRWRVLAAFTGVFTNRYRDWCADPEAELESYRARCATLGRAVQVMLPDGSQLVGEAHELSPAGALLVRDEAGGEHPVAAGDVEHLSQR